ncbi:histone-lysine N-methyltransferase SETMAR-like, partial [Cryptotermes secundus]|uniref:histone-lysine N-methyltransferase SETMAR-like n=1 Tax=Cryptotermes secundus TaxID=105785 RepID=UPI000CD7DC7D
MTDALWYVSNDTLHHDLGISTISDIIQEVGSKHYDRLETHINPLMKPLLEEPKNRRLKRRLPIDLNESVKPIEVHRRMEVQYGDACLSQQHVYEWSREFRSGITSVAEAPRPGQAHRVVTPESVAAVEALVMENGRVSVDEIAESHRSAHRVIHDVLRFHKVSARIVTGDETWVHYHQPETKRTSKEWRHSLSPKPKKFRTQPSAGKIILNLFWDERGVLLEHYTPRGNTITSASYSDLLKNHLQPAVRSKRRGLLTRAVLLQHDNARPHIARATVATTQDLHFECPPHPPYSSDLAPSDYHMFGPLKEKSGGKQFRFDEE